MLSFLHFQDISSIYEDSFWSETPCEDVLIITPGPKEADLMRSQLSTFQTVSISHFLSTHLNQEGLLKKSELIQVLSAIWNKTIKSKSFSYFLESFNLLTEIRNNVSNKELFLEVVDGFDKKLKNFFIASYDFLESDSFFDESRAYRSLVLDKEKIKTKKIIFWGFKFLNTIQVDFIQKASSEVDIFIGLPEYVYENSSMLDWPKWFSGIQKRFIGEKKAFSNGEAFVDNLSVKADFKKKNNIVSNQELTYEWVQSHGKENYYKIDAQYFSFEIEEIKEDLKKNFYKKVLDVQKEIQNLIFKAHKKHDYKYFKLLLLTSNFFKGIDKEIIFDHFYFNLCLEVLRLNSPRVFQVGLSEESTFYSLTEALYLGQKEATCFIESKDFSGSDPQWVIPTKVLSRLASIGAVKNHQLEETFQDYFLLSLLNDKSKEVHIDENFYKDSEKLKDFVLKVKRSELENKEKIVRNYITQEKNNLNRKKYSATSLQTYIDCPQKYYFRYGSKLLKPLISEEIINNLETGSFEHGLIGDYFKEEIKKDKYDLWFEEKYASAFNIKSVDFSKYKERKEKSFRRIQNGIEAIEDLKKNFPDLVMKFEEPIQKSSFEGSADFFAYNDEIEILLDFKASSFGIPTITEVNKLKKIQILYYIDKLLSNDKSKLAGYFCLASPSSSVYFSDYSFSFQGKMIKEKKDFSEVLLKYKSFEKEIINKIESDEVHLAFSNESNVCDFCQFNNICLERK